MSDILQDNQNYSLFKQPKSGSLFAEQNAGSLFGKFNPDPNSPEALQQKIVDAEAQAKQLGVNVPDPTGRKWSLWDLLNIARQPITNVLYTVSKEAGEGDIKWGDVLNSAIMGVGASLPGIGNQIGDEYRRRSEDVLNVLFPDAPTWVKKVGGLAGDILTDPLTYLSFGMAGGAKGAAEAAKAGTEFGAKAVKDFGEAIASHTANTFAKNLIEKYGGETVEEAIRRGIKATAKEAGNYGLKIGIPFVPKTQVPIVSGSPTDWAGNLLKTIGAPKLGQEVAGLGTTLERLPVVGPIVSGFKKAFSTTAEAAGFQGVKDIEKQAANKFSFMKETYKDNYDNMAKAILEAKKDPTVAQIIAQPAFANIADENDRVLEAIKRMRDVGGPIPSALKPLNDQVSAMMDDIKNGLLKAGVLDPKDVVPNYFPRIYRNSRHGGLAEVTVKKTPLRTTNAIPRQFATEQEAIKAGYVPVNPWDALQIYADKSARVITGVDMMKAAADRFGFSLLQPTINAETKKLFADSQWRALSNNIPGMNKVMFPNDIADFLDRTYKIIRDPDELSKLGKALNNFQNFWKRSATIYRPAFTARNTMSNFGTYSLAYGITPEAMSNLEKGFRICDGKGKTALMTAKVEGQDVTKSLDEWYKMSRQAGSNTGIFMRGDINVPANAIQKVQQGISKVTGPARDFATKLNSNVENGFRVGAWLTDMGKGLSVQDAAKTANHWFLDYQDLTRVEQSIKKVIPFYSWLKKNLVNQITYMATMPGRYSMMTIKPWEAMNALTPEEQQNLPDYMKENQAINPFGIQVNGKPLMLNSPFAFTDVSRLQNPGQPIRSLVDLITGAIGPVAKLPIEELTNHSFFTKKPIASSPGAITAIPGLLPNAIAAVIPDVVKEKLNIHMDENGRWMGPAKWVYAINSLSPLTKAGTSLGTVIGLLPGSEADIEKAPFGLASQGVGLSSRPMDTEKNAVTVLKNRLSDIRALNNSKLTDIMNELKRRGGLPIDLQLDDFKRLMKL